MQWHSPCEYPVTNAQVSSTYESSNHVKISMFWCILLAFTPLYAIPLLVKTLLVLLVLNILGSRITGCVCQQLSTYWAHGTHTATHAAVSNSSVVAQAAGFDTTTAPYQPKSI